MLVKWNPFQELERTLELVEHSAVSTSAMETIRSGVNGQLGATGERL